MVVDLNCNKGELDKSLPSILRRALRTEDELANFQGPLSLSVYYDFFNATFHKIFESLQKQNTNKSAETFLSV